MRRTPCIIITALAVCLGLRVSGSEAIPFYGYTAGLTGVYSGNIVGYASGGAGFAFTPLTDIVVTSLGFNGMDLPSEDYSVSVWNSSGITLSTARISASDPLFNQTHYLGITGLPLAAGNTYYLQAVGVASGLWLGEAIIASGPDANGTFSVAPEISYLGYAAGTNGFGAFPAEVHGDPLAYLIGPNFQFEVVPEPSVLCLSGLGLAAIAARHRRRRPS